MIPSFPVYLFDVDGTLVDSAADICGAIQSVLASTPRADVEHDFLKRYIGYHLIDLFRDLFPGKSDDELEHLILDYRATYPKRNHECTQLYPGVLEAIQKLGGRKSTATTKGTPTTRIVLEKFGLLPFFDHVQGTDGFPSKPAPDVIFKSLEVLGVKPEDCLLVGDAAPDMEAGRRAGVKICAVTYGYGNPDAIRRFEPDYWISDLRELLPSN
ncbi:MAG TPA: HAD-IA family hydrolase [Bryobacteraceae bacterium]|nr:HAD-IA family hydrolase [Bryobacteraceae bacterium]